MKKQENNLRPIVLTHEEAIENGPKGGKKSVEKRRERKALKEALEMLLERNYKVDGQTCNGIEAASVALIKQALNGNVKAFEVIRDTIGEKPTDTVNLELNNDQREAYEKAAAAIKGKKQ